MKPRPPNSRAAAYQRNRPRVGWFQVPVKFWSVKVDPGHWKYSGTVATGPNVPPIA
jgi:hypothetical protein